MLDYLLVGLTYILGLVIGMVMANPITIFLIPKDDLSSLFQDNRKNPISELMSLSAKQIAVSILRSIIALLALFFVTNFFGQNLLTGTALGLLFLLLIFYFYLTFQIVIFILSLLGHLYSSIKNVFIKGEKQDLFFDSMTELWCELKYQFVIVAVISYGIIVLIVYHKFNSLLADRIQHLIEKII